MSNNLPRDSAAWSDPAGRSPATPPLAVTILPLQSEEAMNGGTVRQKVRIPNLQGLHIRPATAFVELARRFQSSVFITKDGQRIDGKNSPLELLLLGALQGTELALEVSGPDATEAMNALVHFLEQLIQEDTEQAPAPPPKG